MEKVWMYVDGFNFYYAIKNSGFPIWLGWCDFRRLAEHHIIGTGSTLERIKYFTAPVGDLGQYGEEYRQERWLKAVTTISGLEVIEGFYTKDDSKNRTEKQTDVNIAVELLRDAIRPNGFDVAVLVSADIDLAPAAHAVQNRLPCHKPVHVWMPLSRPPWRWRELSRTDGVQCHEIEPGMLMDSRLDDRIITNKGPIDCLPQWRMPQK